MFFEFTKVTEEMPEAGKLVLVRSLVDNDICLARWLPDENEQWKVQPFGGQWYWTKKGVVEWMYLPTEWPDLATVNWKDVTLLGVDEAMPDEPA